MTIEEIRFQIVTTAFEVQSKGSHYLWGSAGDIPDLDTSGLSQPGIKSQIANIFAASQNCNEQHPQVMTAETSVAGKKFVCAGSYKNFSTGNPVDMNNADEANTLSAYLTSLNNIPVEEWQIQKGELTPRLYNNAVVWGQDCRSVAHFDCVGFVNYCVSQALGRAVIYEIEQWATNMSGTVNTDLYAPAENADLLFVHGNGPKFGHIALLYRDEDGIGTVIQAADTDIGVITGPYEPAKWSARRTITTALLH